LRKPTTTGRKILNQTEEKPVNVRGTISFRTKNRGIPKRSGRKHSGVGWGKSKMCIFVKIMRN